MVGEKLMSISQNEGERARFRSRRKFLTDYQSDMNTSWDNGRAEGFMEVARKMLERGRPIEEILEFTGLSREEAESLRIE